MTTPHAPPRIAIIGAGPAGLSAAWFLQRNGYSNVRVFEKLDRVGGKCLTLTYDGRPFDMAAHEMLAGYGDVMDIANALNVPTTGYQAVLVYDRATRRYMDMLTACQSGGRTKLEVIWASLRYTWLLLTRYRRVSQPGSGFAGTPQDLLQPLTSWLKEQRLEALRETVSFVMKVQGFGRLDQLAAAYFVKFQGLRNWLSNVLHVAGLIQSWPRVFRHGFQSLWNAVAQHVDMQLGAQITAIRRRAKPDSNVVKVEIEFRDGQREEFDEIILACPLDLRTLSELGLDVGPEEQRVLEKVQYVDFVTTACRVEGVPAGVVGTIPLPPLLDYSGYIKIHDDRDMAVFFNLAPSEQLRPCGDRAEDEGAARRATAPRRRRADADCGAQPTRVAVFPPRQPDRVRRRLLRSVGIAARLPAHVLRRLAARIRNRGKHRRVLARAGESLLSTGTSVMDALGASEGIAHHLPQRVELAHMPVGVGGDEQPRVAAGLDRRGEKSRPDATVQMEEVELQRAVEPSTRILESTRDRGAAVAAGVRDEASGVGPVGVLPLLGKRVRVAVEVVQEPVLDRRIVAEHPVERDAQSRHRGGPVLVLDVRLQVENGLLAHIEQLVGVDLYHS